MLDHHRFIGGERIDAAISELNFETRKVNLSIKLLEELQNQEAALEMGLIHFLKNFHFHHFRIN